MLDLTAHVLSVLDSWDTNNYSPKPALINKNDAAFYSNAPGNYSGGDRTHDFDHTQASIIKVGNGPDRQQTPIGTEYDYDVEDAVGVTIQAVHEDEYGEIADHAEFLSLVGEARRLIQADRKFPLDQGDEYYPSLQVDLESDNSDEYMDFYEYTFDVTFDGYEELSSV